MAEIKQRIVSCPQGHYFDANAYSSCPLCGELAIGSSNSASEKRDQGSFTDTLTPAQMGGSYAGNGRPVAVASPDVRAQAPEGDFGKTTAPASYSRPQVEEPRYPAPSAPSASRPP